MFLDLSECHCLDDEGIGAIANRCIHFKVVEVHENDSITDVGITMVINNCCQLVVLSFIKIIDVCIKSFV
jgi:predicted transcriptional regulator